MLLAAYLWGTRSGSGRRRRLPPGSLSLLPFGYLLSRRFFLQQAARHGPVFKTTQFGAGAGPNPFFGWIQPVVCVLGWERALELLRKYDEVLIPPEAPFSRFIPGRYLRYMEPADHARYRRIFHGAFRDDAIFENEAILAERIRKGFGAMVRESQSAGARGIQPEPWIARMHFETFTRIFFGIAPETPCAERLHRLHYDIRVENEDEDEVCRALEEIESILIQQAEALQRQGDAAPASFLREIIRLEPTAMEDVAVRRNLAYILQASWIDASGLTLWLLKLLCDEPRWLDPVREAIEQGRTAEADQLADCIVAETLRLFQSEYLYRRTLEEISVDDFVIPKGWLLRICVTENHRDPKVFADPDTFCPDRFRDRKYSRLEYAPFGATRISCLGEVLTTTLGRNFVKELAGGFVTALVSDGPLEYRRWHWKPSSRFRIRVEARDPLVVPASTDKTEAHPSL